MSLCKEKLQAKESQNKWLGSLIIFTFTKPCTQNFGSILQLLSEIIGKWWSAINKVFLKYNSQDKFPTLLALFEVDQVHF